MISAAYQWDTFDPHKAYIRQLLAIMIFGVRKENARVFANNNLQKIRKSEKSCGIWVEKMQILPVFLK